MQCRTSLFAAVLVLTMSIFPSGTPLAGEEKAQASSPIPILLDTDIGNDIDDVFALALILTSPELDLRGVTTVGVGPVTRAQIVSRMLNAIGRHNVPVVAGSDPQPGAALKDQARYLDTAPDPDVPQTSKPAKEMDAVEFLYRRFKEAPGKLTLVAIGPLTNVARLLSEHPDCKPWIPRIVIMGGAVHVDYNGQPKPEVEWNLKSDIAAARTVFSAGIPLVVAPLDATYHVALGPAERKRIFDVKGPLQRQVELLYKFWNKPTPILFDPVAIALVFDEKLCEMKDLRLEVDSTGRTVAVDGKPNSRVAVSIRRDEFVSWFTERLMRNVK